MRPLAHVVLGEDHVVGADAVQDAAVLGADRLGPDVVDLQLDQQRRGEDAGLDVAADGHHRPVEVGHAQLAQRLHVGGVSGRDLGDLPRQRLRDLRPVVDGQHLGAAPGQLQRQ
jgi:hypothetical protein